MPEGTDLLLYALRFEKVGSAVRKFVDGKSRCLWQKKR